MLVGSTVRSRFVLHTLNTHHHTHPLHGATQFAISIARLIDLFLHSSVILCFCRFTYIEAILRTRVRANAREAENERTRMRSNEKNERQLLPVVAGARSLSKLAQVERQRARARLVAIEHHANEAVGVLVKVVVVRHDEELHVLLLLLEELDHAANVVLVERRVDLVQNEEGRRSEAGRSIAAV